jgi:lipopolysaccharide biosynthesis glycosyltransferase
MKKIGFCTILNDFYFKGFLYTFASILKTTPNFNYELNIFEWGELNDDNKSIIKKIYNKVVFKKIDKNKYLNYKFDSEYREWKYNCAYRFEIFNLQEYSKIVYFDCDFLFEISMEELLKNDVRFGACQMQNKIYDVQVENQKVFNAGLMIIDNCFLNQKTIDDLNCILLSPPPQKNKWVGNQPILNKYFYDKITWIPDKFNTTSENISYKNINKNLNYHFVGNKKPWNTIKYDRHILNCINKNNNNNIMLNNIVFKNIDKKYKDMDIFISKILA